MYGAGQAYSPMGIGLDRDKTRQSLKGSVYTSCRL